MTEKERQPTAQEISIVTDLMDKVAKDVSDAIMRTATLVPAPDMAPIAHRAAMQALIVNGMMFDAAAGNIEKSPTQACAALAAYVVLNTILGANDPWHDAVAKVKEHFPDAKLPEVTIVDRRPPKEAQAA